MLLLFIGSGCAALIYEIVWLQLLQLLIGSTAVSMGVLLAIFMGGMCLGSLAFHRWTPKHFHPLAVYASLELGIAVCALLVLFSMPSIERLYSMLSSGHTGIAQRALIAAICLLAPTVMMGATLPAIARWVESTPRGMSWLGFFYGGNILGAVLGCLLAGFYLLREFDMAIATYVAVGINMAVALLSALLLSTTRQSASQANDAELAPPPAGRFSIPEHVGASPSPIYIAIALSGMSALGAEVVWTRLLSLLLGGTVYTFSIILAVFLFGLGIGSALGSLLARVTVQPVRSLALCQLLSVAGVTWTANVIARSLPHWPIDPTLATNIAYTFHMDLARCLVSILPATLCWGASFPLALACLVHPQVDPAQLVGRTYAANTLGAIVGALLFSLFLIPYLGSLFAQYGLVAIATLSTGSILFASRQGFTARQSPANGRYWAVAAILLALSSVWTLPEIPWSVIGYGRFAARYERFLAPEIVQPEAIPTNSQGQPSEFCLMTGEGINVSVAVSQTRDGIRKFHGGGKVQASSSAEDMRLQRMLGHLPALIHVDPQEVLVVACGAGVTAGSFLPHPEVKSLVICDIEPLVPTKVTPYFAEHNHNVVGPENADRVRIHYDDGRHFMRTTEQKFDIITSDPIDPWVKGCAALNTVEYYQMCRAKLKPGGIMALWMPLYESDPETLKSVIATFFEVFPEGILWTNDFKGDGYDAVLFGQVGGTRINLDEIQTRFERPDHTEVRESLRQVGFEDLSELLATYAGSAEALRPWTAGAQLNTDLNLRLQYLAGLSVNSYMGGELLDGILDHYQFPREIFEGSPFLQDKLKRQLMQAGRPE